MSITTLHNDFLTVTIDSMGAQILSILDQQGQERIWQRDATYWTSCAPILFPIAGGLRDDCYTLGGKHYDMPKHGYVRLLPWQLENSEDTKAVFLMKEKQSGFPFDYELRAIFTLHGSELEVKYQVINTGDETFWYGIGSHEAYATPGGLEAYTLVFDEEERFDNYVLHGNLIANEPVLMAENTNVFPLKTDYFAVDALVFRTLKSRGVTLESKEHHRKVRVEFPKHDVLMLWTKPGADYICIEPWINAPDLMDSDGQIEHKPGCVCLLPGEREQHIHQIIIS